MRPDIHVERWEREKRGPIRTRALDAAHILLRVVRGLRDNDEEAAQIYAQQRAHRTHQSDQQEIGAHLRR